MPNTSVSINVFLATQRITKHFQVTVEIKPAVLISLFNVTGKKVNGKVFWNVTFKYSYSGSNKVLYGGEQESEEKKFKFWFLTVQNYNLKKKN